MKIKPLISVVIPTYNEEAVIEKCLNSLVRQEIAKKIEVLIVDDESKDNTLKIVRSFSNRLKIRIIKNGTRDAERGKKIGLMACKGKFFMYLDADMEYAQDNWLSASVKPLIEGKRVIGTIASFGVNKNHNALTRCISYDIFQRDPIFAAFTPNIYKSVIEKREGYFLCKFNLNNIPAQSLCLYRTEILKKLFKESYHLMDNDVPVILVEHGYVYFAFCPQVKVYHKLLNNLRELFSKRMRGVLKTYTANLNERKYKWFNLEKKQNILKLGIWIVYANLLAPAFLYGAYKTIKNKDFACMYEPLITLVSTDALIYGFLKSKKGLKVISKV